MKRRKIPATLCAALLCLALLTAITSYFLPLQMKANAQAAEKQAFDRQAVEKASVSFEAAAAIFEKLQTMVADELSQDEGDDNDFDVDVAEEFINELGGDLVQIGMLQSGLAGLKDDKDSSEGKTVLAVREYLTMLHDISLDMQELLQYYVELYEAFTAMSDFGDDYDSYTEFAEQLIEATGAAIELMEMIKPPSYLKIAHDDLTTRIREFQDFGSDFYVASYLDDPLRTYSCVYRMDRIQTSLDRCADNLTADVELQFVHADSTLSGPVSLLHDELERNIARLLAA